MDAHDIFRKLAGGAKFSRKRYANNFKKIEDESIDSVDIKIKTEPIDIETYNDGNVGHTFPTSSSDKRKETLDINLLGNIKVENEVKSETTKETKTNKQQNLEREQVNHFRNINRISVKGTRIADPIETFEQLLNSEYNILPQLFNNIKTCGYSAPTPIQMQAIPIMFNGRQLLACAPTGSGKTAAFLIPIINHLRQPSKNGFRALIICPTRELARQIFRVSNLLTEGTGICSYLISKVSEKHVALGANFTNKFDIVITTPNRLIYLMKQEKPINLKTVEWLIVDESDKLFEVGVRGFREQLAAIYKECDSSHLKRGMFSATFTYDVAKWCKKNLKGLISVTIGHRNTTTDLIEQKFVFVGNEHGKLLEFRNLIHEGLQPPVLVFVQSKERAKELFRELIYDSINVDVIHADRTQLQRDNVVKAFREGKIWVLICTELMGRGIDFKGVNLVINYDLPQSAISYIHRIGRTGRAGRPGKAITFFTLEDKPLVRSIGKVMADSGCDVPEYILKLGKTSKKMKRKMENRATKRENISVGPKNKKVKKTHKTKQDKGQITA